MRISEVRELDDTELDKELGEQERGLMNLLSLIHISEPTRPY